MGHLAVVPRPLQDHQHQHLLRELLQPPHNLSCPPGHGVVPYYGNMLELSNYNPVYVKWFNPEYVGMDEVEYAGVVDDNECWYNYNPVMNGLFTWIIAQATPTPEPSTIVLLGVGCFGLLGYAWRWKRLV